MFLQSLASVNAGGLFPQRVSFYLERLIFGDFRSLSRKHHIYLFIFICCGVFFCFFNTNYAMCRGVKRTCSQSLTCDLSNAERLIHIRSLDVVFQKAPSDKFAERRAWAVAGSLSCRRYRLALSSDLKSAMKPVFPRFNKKDEKGPTSPKTAHNFLLAFHELQFPYALFSDFVPLFFRYIFLRELREHNRILVVLNAWYWLSVSWSFNRPWPAMNHGQRASN